MANGKFIGYYRVSTSRQGRSGLGLDGQRAAVLGYLNGGAWTLVAEAVEVESGKRKDRPKLDEALRLCRLHKATLVIAKLDRLARNLHFVSTLMEAGVEFVALDLPEANRLTIHVMAAFAEHEAHAISERTKAALAAAKAKGRQLGGVRPGQRLTDDMRAAGRAKIAGRSSERAAELAPVIADLRAKGVTSLGGIARALTADGIPTARGKGEWSEVQVSRVLARIPA